MRAGLLLVLFLSFSFQTFAQEIPQAKKKNQRAVIPNRYVEKTILQAGDTVRIIVFQHPEMDRELQIAPDGKLYYLMIEPVTVLNKPLSTVIEEVSRQLSKFVVSPQVDISVVKSNSEKFIIMGQIRSPGIYPILPGMRLIEAIALAGGFPQSSGELNAQVFEDLDNSFIVEKKGTMLDIDFKKLVKEGSEKDNILISPGDYIYIASSLQRQIFVLGEVFAPQSISYRDNLSLTRIMSMTHFTPKANLDRIVILRQADSRYQMNIVNFNDILNQGKKDYMLLPDDIVYVSPQEPLPFSDLFDLAKRSFVNTYVSKKALQLYNLTFSDVTSP